MREFDRIVTDYKKLGGLPHFQDTTITVSEVVRMVMSGAPNADILAQYPDLEPYDIQDALAFAVQNLLEQVTAWANEGRTPLTTIGGYSALLAQDEHDDLSNEEKQTFARAILRATGQAGNAWACLSGWANSSFRQQNDYLGKSKSLSSIIGEVQSILDDPRREVTAEFRISGESPSNFSSGSELSVALSHLIQDNGFDQLALHSIVSVEVVDTKPILFTIRRTYNENVYDLDSESLLAWRGSPTAIAALIIHQHGSELKITPDEEGVTFEFELPVWQDRET